MKPEPSKGFDHPRAYKGPFNHLSSGSFVTAGIFLSRRPVDRVLRACPPWVPGCPHGPMPSTGHVGPRCLTCYVPERLGGPQSRDPGSPPWGLHPHPERCPWRLRGVAGRAVICRDLQPGAPHIQRVSAAESGIRLDEPPRPSRTLGESLCVWTSERRMIRIY
jgi:hypothetical protein